MTDRIGSSVPEEAVTLPSGREMPLLGFGTWQITGEEAVRATTAALSAGYRHLDTAHVYENEGEVGRGIRDSGVRREDIFITTKIPPGRADQHRETLERSLELLGVDHVDLWLIHWSVDDEVHADLWRALQEARSDGLAGDIGVSNYSVPQLDRLAEVTGEMPAVNQIEWSPLLFEPDVLAAHRERGVVLEGYSGLRGGVLEHEAVVGLARQLGRTPAQVVIRWHLQHGVVVIPKSREPNRIRANVEVGSFALDPAEMAVLDALGAHAAPE
ncbi:MAG: aldo/keto reductase [Nocardioides sp.]|nr:aldo/keto reductase [Nocardioides sp.]